MRPSAPLLVVLAAAVVLACDEEAPHQGTPPAPTGDTGAPPEEAAPFVLSLATDRLPVPQGGSAEVEVTVTRADGFEGPVVITARDLPGGVVAEPLTVAADEERGALVLVADGDAPHSLPTAATVTGAGGGVEDDEPLAVTVYGPPGSLDTSFAGGRVVVPAGASDDYAYALAVQADGKLVVAGVAAEGGGDLAVVRLDRDGALDATFGDGGVVTTDLGTSDVAYAVAVQPDGRIVVAGATTGAGTGRDFALVRYTADGALDATFGDGGVVTTSFGADSDTAYALALQPDGRIVAGGESNQGSSGSGVDFALARYLDDGALDPTFGEGGKVVTSLVAHGGRDTVYALALAEVDGEPVVVAAGGEGDFRLARYLDDGALDEGFGEGGRVVGLFGSTIGAARAVQVDREGRVVVAGHSHHDFAIARLDAVGAPDPSFGTDGLVLTPISEDNWDEARGVALEDGGGVVVAGWTFEGNTSAGDFAIVRYAADGALDPAFGDAGVVITPGLAPNRRDEGAAVVLQVDDRVPTVRVIAAGSAGGEGNSEFAVARYWR